MAVEFPEEFDSPEYARTAIFREVLFGRGWTRYLPPASIILLSALASQGPRTEAEFEHWIGPQSPDSTEQSPWDEPAWDPVKVWTDDEWAEHTASVVDTPFELGPDAPVNAAAANVEEAQDHQEQIARFDAFSAVLGVAQVRTMRDVLTFLIACGVVVRRFNQQSVTYELARDVGLPAEVLPLSAEEQRHEDELRWADLHGATAQKIIDLFGPHDEEPLDRMQTSLQRLARQLGTDVEAARAGAQVLLHQGDFHATRDLERAAEHHVFELVVDWNLFARTRIGLRTAAGAADEE